MLAQPRRNERWWVVISINIIWIMQCKLDQVTFSLLLAEAFYHASSFSGLLHTYTRFICAHCVMSHSPFEVSTTVLSLQPIATHLLWMQTPGSSSLNIFFVHTRSPCRLSSHTIICSLCISLRPTHLVFFCLLCLLLCDLFACLHT